MKARLSFLVVFVCIFSISISVFAQEGVYTDKEAKFSITPTDGWKVSARKIEPNVVFVGLENPQIKDSARISISRSIMVDKEGLLEYYVISYLRDLRKTTANFKNTAIKKIKLNGQDCIQTICEYGLKNFDPIKYIETITPEKSVMYFLRNKDSFFVIRTSSIPQDFDKDKALLDKITSTFKIIQ